MFLGPVIRSAHKARTLGYIEKGDGARCRARSATAEERNGRKRGRVLHRTDDFDHVTQEMAIWQDEIFAPVLPVVRVNSLEEAIAMANAFRISPTVAVFIPTAPKRSAISLGRRWMQGCSELISACRRRWRSSLFPAIRNRSTAICMQTAKTASNFNAQEDDRGSVLNTHTLSVLARKRNSRTKVPTTSLSHDIIECIENSSSNEQKAR